MSLCKLNFVEEKHDLKQGALVSDCINCKNWYVYGVSTFMNLPCILQDGLHVTK